MPYDASYTVLCSPGNVGTGSGRQSANEEWVRNLSRCVASSSPGTNDHYFYAPAPNDLPNIFVEIAAKVKGSRLVPVVY